MFPGDDLFLALQRCTLCLDKGVLAWREDVIPLVVRDDRLLANIVSSLPHYHPEWRFKSAVDSQQRLANQWI